MTRRLPAKVLALLAFCCALFACSAEGPSAHEEGSIALGLTLPPGVQIDQVTLRILRDGEGVLLLTIPVDALGATASAFAQLPAGTGYVAELEARSVDGTTSCVGSEPFEVVASQTTSLTIPLACRLPLPNTGGIIVGVSFNSCPVVSSVVAAPAQVPVGASLQLHAVASDPNGDPLSLRWVATSGELAFGNALGATNTLVCTEPGPSTVTFVATDGACETRLSVSVSCSPGTCGDGPGQLMRSATTAMWLPVTVATRCVAVRFAAMVASTWASSVIRLGLRVATAAASSCALATSARAPHAQLSSVKL
jgi:hypothetical protein